MFAVRLFGNWSQMTSNVLGTSVTLRYRLVRHLLVVITF